MAGGVGTSRKMGVCCGKFRGDQVVAVGIGLEVGLMDAILSQHRTAKMLLLGVNTEEEPEGVERELLAATAVCRVAQEDWCDDAMRCGAAALSLFSSFFFSFRTWFCVSPQQAGWLYAVATASMHLMGRETRGRKER